MGLSLRIAGTPLYMGSAYVILPRALVYNEALVYPKTQWVKKGI